MKSHCKEAAHLERHNCLPVQLDKVFPPKTLTANRIIMTSIVDKISHEAVYAIAIGPAGRGFHRWQ